MNTSKRKRIVTKVVAFSSKSVRIGKRIISRPQPITLNNLVGDNDLAL